MWVRTESGGQAIAHVAPHRPQPPPGPHRDRRRRRTPSHIPSMRASTSKPATALFGRKAPAPPPPPPAKKCVGGGGARRWRTGVERLRAAGDRREAPAGVRAAALTDLPFSRSLFGRSKPAPAPPAPAPKKSLFGRAKPAAAAAAAPVPRRKQSFMEAFDFQENIEADAILIAKARGMARGDKMSPAQYAAMRRKVGGTAKSFFKEYVQAEGKYVEKGYVSDDEEPAVGIPPGAWALGLTLAGLAAATVAVVQRT